MIFTDSKPCVFSDPIHNRAWTYQERRLSPRLLDFTTTRVKWLCRETLKDEFYKPTHIQHHQYAGDLRVPDHIDYMPCLSGQPMSSWRSVVSKYCTRRLTNSNDKLVAISAIAEIYRRSEADVYLAGLWKHDLLEQLCWSIAKGTIPHLRPVKKLPRPLEYLSLIHI